MQEEVHAQHEAWPIILIAGPYNAEMNVLGCSPMDDMELLLQLFLWGSSGPLATSWGPLEATGFVSVAQPLTWTVLSQAGGAFGTGSLVGAASGCMCAWPGSGKVSPSSPSLSEVSPHPRLQPCALTS